MKHLHALCILILELPQLKENDEKKNHLVDENEQMWDIWDCHPSVCIFIHNGYEALLQNSSSFQLKSKGGVMSHFPCFVIVWSVIVTQRSKNSQDSYIDIMCSAAIFVSPPDYTNIESSATSPALLCYCRRLSISVSCCCCRNYNEATVSGL